MTPLIRVSGEGAELLLHAGSGSRGGVDGCCETYIDLVAPSFWSSLGPGGVMQMAAGDIMAAGLAQPCPEQDAKPQMISLFLSHPSVQAIIGDARCAGGRTLAPGGVATLLKSHMRATMEQAELLSPKQRVMAIQIARDMAFSILRTESRNDTDDAGHDAEELAAGFYRAAKIFISRKCTDPELTPERVASAIGCSRAGLYRAFVKHGQSVAAAIWTARLEHASAMLTSSICAKMPISEIAFRSGFNDNSTFNRLFKRTYGSAPGEARKVG